MKVKVQCPCGTRFEFDVEPLNGRMPVGINCPGCNEGATELANAVIRQQSAPPAVGISAAPVMPPSPPPPAPAPPPSSSLRISKSPSAHAAPAAAAPAPVTPGDADAPADSSIQLCPKHKKEPAVDSCVVCGKPLCLLCMEQFGHVCSVYCRQQAEHKRIYIPAYAHQRSVLAEKSNHRAKLITAAVAFLVLAVFGLWFYYAWFARNPKVVFSLVLADKSESIEERKKHKPQSFKLVAPNQLLNLKDKQAILLDITKNQPIWTTSLQSDSDAAKPDGKKGLAALDDYYFANPLIFISTNDIWLALHDRLIRLDRLTGARKDNPVPGPVTGFYPGDNCLLASFIDPTGQHMLARVNLADGAIQTTALTASVKPAAKTPAVKRSASGKSAPGAGQARANIKMDQVQAAAAAAKAGVATTDGDTLTAGGKIPSEYIDDNAPAVAPVVADYYEAPPFTVAGEGAVELQSRLLEQKTITHQAMKPKGKTLLDGNITASQGTEYAQEFANDMQRDATGGVEIEDVSRYQVTLHRWFAGDAPDWTGEVMGPPRFCPLKTIDLVVAGQSIIAFDRSNKKLWEGKLSYPMLYSGGRLPALETRDAVYFADPGVLTCFDRATGAARWRVNSVGISSVQADARGQIYITTTTAGQDAIRFSQQKNFHEKIRPVIEKIDPATGKVLWKLESVGEEVLMSGKFFYCTYISQTQSALKFEEGPDTHFNLDLLNPGNGSTIWNFHVDNRMILETEVQQNWILLHFDNKVVVLKFFSL